jgi:hypothetical protein
MNGHTAPVTSVAYSPDGQRIITGSSDKTAKLWDATSGQSVLTFNAHAERVSSVAFSPDGRHIVTSSDDRSAIVWHAAAPEQVAIWKEEDEALDQRRTAAQKLQNEEQERKRIARARDAGAIKRWLILAAIPLPADLTYSAGFTYGLDTEHIEDERLLRPSPGEKSSLPSGDLTWRTVDLEDNIIDFIAFAGRVDERSAAYAVCYINSETEQSGLQMLVGSSGRAKAYLNGKQVHEYRFGHGFEPDQDVVKNLTLKAGVNALVFKVVIEPRRPAWPSSIRFTDRDGSPLNGITVTYAP